MRPNNQAGLKRARISFFVICVHSDIEPNSIQPIHIDLERGMNLSRARVALLEVPVRKHHV